MHDRLPLSTPPANPLLTSPVLATMVRLSLPNMAAMVATTLVAIAETSYVGLLGTPALAGLALVFPMVMLQQMMSAGAMGGGVSSAISRAMGAGDKARAEALAFHAVVIAVGASILFGLLFLLLGGAIYRVLGGKDAALAQAIAYSDIVFVGLISIWLANTLASVLRGTGNMRVPSATIFGVAVVQIVLGGGLGFGLGPFPRLGMAGVAAGQVLAYGAGAIVFLWLLRSGRARIGLRVTRLDRALFRDILKVGAVACISPLQTVITILILTRLVAHFGTEALAGYGIGSRLEFLLIPITFAIGVACVPLVGMAVGAGAIARARKVAWTGGILSAAILGVVGIGVALLPDLWARLFTTDPAVLASTRSYLILSGPGYAFLGLGLCLYFAAQGAGKVGGPVMAGTLRMVLVAGVGWALAHYDAPQWTLFALVGAAMAAYGIATATAVWLVPWGPRVASAAKP